MLKLFQKKKADNLNVQAHETEFLTAKQALEESSQSWLIKTRAEILEKIKKEVKYGRRHACFINAYITGEDAIFLRELGYRVEVLKFEKEPAFIIYW